MNLLDHTSFRQKCYRAVLVSAPSAENSLQGYRAEWQEAQREVLRLFRHLEARSLSPSAEAELLLTIFVGLQVGCRNWTLYERAVDRAYALLPRLSVDPAVTATPRGRRLFCHLLVHLHMETEDDTLVADIDRLLSEWSPATLTEEDRCLLDCYTPVRSTPHAVTT